MSTCGLCGVKLKKKEVREHMILEWIEWKFFLQKRNQRMINSVKYIIPTVNGLVIQKMYSFKFWKFTVTIVWNSIK